MLPRSTKQPLSGCSFQRNATVPLFSYGQERDKRVPPLREEEVSVRTEAGLHSQQSLALMTQACALQVFRLNAVGVPVPAPVSREVLEVAARDPFAQWVPHTTGPYAQACRFDRPSGTASWRCLLVALGKGDIIVRLLWAGDSLRQALQELEDAFWHMLPRPFVVAVLIAAKLGRSCMGAEGPIAAAAVPWGRQDPPAKPPAPLSRRQIDELASRCVEELAHRRTIQVPERGSDAYRFLVKLGSLVWREENVRSLAHVYSGVAEAPSVLVHAIALHAYLHHPMRVSVGETSIEAVDHQASDGLWAQWAEWLLCGVPPEFLQWVHPDGLYRASEMLEPREADVPEADTSRALECALVQDAERNARYVPYGAFVLEVPEELFLRRWGIHELWLWVQGRRVWCAVSGEDGLPCESFCWEAGRGVLSDVVVPLPTIPALGVALAAVWRDLVVAGEDATPARRVEQARQRGDYAATVRVAEREICAVFPRRRARPVSVSGYRVWGTSEDRQRARWAHTVRGHLRRLPAGHRRSVAAEAAAAEHGIVLPDGYTFVRPHARGSRPSRHDQMGTRTRVIAKGLRTLAAVLHT